MSRNDKSAIIAICIIVGLMTLAIIASHKGYIPNPKTSSERPSEQAAELERRVERGIPTLRNLLRQQAQEIQLELSTDASSSVKATLDQELRDIARSLASLDIYEKECMETTARIRSVIRRMQLRTSVKEYLGDDEDPKLEDIQKMEGEAAGKLGVKLGPKLGYGVIEDVLVEEKLLELRKKSLNDRR